MFVLGTKELKRYGFAAGASPSTNVPDPGFVPIATVLVRLRHRHPEVRIVRALFERHRESRTRLLVILQAAEGLAQLEDAVGVVGACGNTFTQQRQCVYREAALEQGLAERVADPCRRGRERMRAPQRVDRLGISMAARQGDPEKIPGFRITGQKLGAAAECRQGRMQPSVVGQQAAKGPLQVAGAGRQGRGPAHVMERGLLLSQARGQQRHGMVRGGGIGIQRQGLLQQDECAGRVAARQQRGGLLQAVLQLGRRGGSRV